MHKCLGVFFMKHHRAITTVKGASQRVKESYRKVININQVSVFLGMKAVLPSMRKIEAGSIGSVE